MNNNIVNYDPQSFYPTVFDEEEIVLPKTSYPIANLSALGVGFEPITAAIQNVMGKQGTVSGIYRVTIPAGGKLAAFKDGSGFVGSVLKESGAVGGGQARINPLICDPTYLCMMAAFMNIQKKLDEIKAGQKEIMDYLALKEKATLQSNYMFLTEVMQNYKLNWNNEMYKNTASVKVMDIKQSSLTSINMCRSLIKNKLQSAKAIQGNKDVKKRRDEIISDLNDYQKAVYIYAMSSFAEVLLFGNFSSEYLNNILKGISNQSSKYRELYTDIYN